jgi:hypothetical protein
MTRARLLRLEAELRRLGHGPAIDWSQAIEPPADADDFADRAIYVICNSGMRVTIAAPIHERCMEVLRSGGAVAAVYGHAGKAQAIETIWRERARLYADFLAAADDPLSFVATLPWIGPVTRHHLAKNLGIDDAKPDVHLERLARREGVSVHELCQRLAHETGYRMATIDTILWRACADGVLNSRRYQADGWDAAVTFDSS